MGSCAKHRIIYASCAFSSKNVHARANELQSFTINIETFQSKLSQIYELAYNNHSRTFKILSKKDSVIKVP